MMEAIQRTDEPQHDDIVLGTTSASGGILTFGKGTSGMTWWRITPKLSKHLKGRGNPPSKWKIDNSASPLDGNANRSFLCDVLWLWGVGTRPRRLIHYQIAFADQWTHLHPRQYSKQTAEEKMLKTDEIFPTSLWTFINKQEHKVSYRCSLPSPLQRDPRITKDCIGVRTPREDLLDMNDMNE